MSTYMIQGGYSHLHVMYIRGWAIKSTNACVVSIRSSCMQAHARSLTKHLSQHMIHNAYNTRTLPRAGLEVLLRAGPVVVVVGVGSSGAPVARGPSGADGDGCCSGAVGSVLLGPSESSGGGMCAGLSRSMLTVS